MRVTPALAAQVGLTYRQVDYWLRKFQGIGDGHGYPRDLTVEQTQRLRLYADLLHAGFTAPVANTIASRISGGVTHVDLPGDCFRLVRLRLSGT